MDIITCSQCGVEIERKGIHFKSRHFCSDECCEEFESVLAEGSEPGEMELAATDSDAADDLDLGYRGDGDGDGDGDDDNILDDNFDIKPEDF